MLLSSRLLTLTRGLVRHQPQQKIARLWVVSAAAAGPPSGGSGGPSSGSGSGSGDTAMPKTKAASQGDAEATTPAASPAVSPRKRARRSPAGAGAAAAASPSPASPARKSPKQRLAAAAAAAAAGATPSPARKSPRVSAAAAKEAAAAAAAAAAADAAAAAAADAKQSAKPAVQLKQVPGARYDADTMRPPRLADPAVHVMAWNVAGLRALVKKDAGAVRRLVEQEKVDVMCLQETKLQDSHVAQAIQDLGMGGWAAAFNCSQAKKGYSGTAIFCRTKPISSSFGMGVPQCDDEGRVVTVELPGFFVVNAYVPNSGDGLKRLDYRLKQWDVAFCNYVKGLEARGKPVIVAGDLNVCHHPIDIHSPKTNLKSAGFTPEERESFGRLMVAPEGLLIDTFRAAHPGIVGYTYYSHRFNARAKGAGWRLDYCLVSQSLSDRVHDSYILKDIEGSDHVPLGIIIKKP